MTFVSHVTYSLLLIGERKSLSYLTKWKLIWNWNSYLSWNIFHRKYVLRRQTPFSLRRNFNGTSIVLFCDFGRKWRKLQLSENYRKQFDTVSWDSLNQSIYLLTEKILQVKIECNKFKSTKWKDRSKH